MAEEQSFGGWFKDTLGTVVGTAGEYVLLREQQQLQAGQAVPSLETQTNVGQPSDLYASVPQPTEPGARFAAAVQQVPVAYWLGAIGLLVVVLVAVKK
jgi:hypothetical protein